MGIDLEGSDKRKQDIWEKQYKVNTDSFKIVGPPIHTQINIYTDGSKTNEHVGSGFVIYRGNLETETHSIRLLAENTVYQAEIFAIKCGAEKLLEVIGKNDKYIKLFSDSQAALMSLNKWQIKSKLVYNTILSLNKLAKRVCRLELVWIKAHNNYKGNESADKLAKNAIYDNIAYFGIDLPQSHYKKALWEAIYTEWTTRWQDEVTCRMTKVFYPRVHKSKSKSLLKMSRNKSRRIIEMINGQSNLYYVQNKATGNDFQCRFCEEEEETFDHLILECPVFFNQRNEIMGDKQWNGTHAWSFNKLWNFANIPAIKQALDGNDNTEHDEMEEEN